MQPLLRGSIFRRPLRPNHRIIGVAVLSTDCAATLQRPDEGTELIKLISNIRTSGTVRPSSNFLIDRLLRPVDFARAERIVELGAGNGCVTREILRRMRPDARLVSLEKNAAFVEECRSIRDDRIELLHACATDLPYVLAELGIDGVDYVVSSLPLAIMNQDRVARVLEVSRGSLRADGMFLQYQYSLRHFANLNTRYREVRLGFTLRNLPPAFVYECMK